MQPFNLRLAVVTAGFALAAAPAFAQRPSESGTSPAAERPTAVERPATGGGPSGGGGGGSVATSGGSSGGSGMSSGSPSAGAAASPTFSGAGRAAYREEAPQHRGGSASGQSASPRGGGQQSSGQSASPRSGGNQSSGERATPRGSGSSTQSGSTHAASPSGNAASAAPSNATRDNRPIPPWARPRGDHPAGETAVARTVPRADNRGGVIYYDPYYGSGIFNSFGVLYGGRYAYYNCPFGNSFFDPYCGNPYALGYGFGLGFPMMYDPWYAGGNDPYWSGYNSSQGQTGDEGHLRLKVKPRDAKVYIDGLFVGTIDDMDGMFQKFPLTPGRHRVEIRADGYQPETFDAVITARETVTFQGQLKRIQ
jgi:PEGA domain-containing protein